MRKTHTRGSLLSRLEQLEVQTAASAQVQVRIGKLRRLPADYMGERHVIVAKQLPSRNGPEWVEFEEIAGPDPNPPAEQWQRGLSTLISVRLVAPDPSPEQAP